MSTPEESGTWTSFYHFHRSREKYDTHQEMPSTMEKACLLLQLMTSVDLLSLRKLEIPLLI